MLMLLLLLMGGDEVQECVYAPCKPLALAFFFFLTGLCGDWMEGAG